MEKSEIESLHDRAAALYSEGRYEEARGCWERMLEAAPSEPRALEGLNLIDCLLSKGGEPVGQGSDESAAPSDPALEAEIVQVEQLLIAGRTAEALESLDILRELYPDCEEIRWLAGRARSRLESEPFLAGEAEAAKHAWRRGDDAALREACAHMLAVEPDHQFALGLMEAAGYGAPIDWAPETPIAIAQESPETEASTIEPEPFPIAAFEAEPEPIAALEPGAPPPPSLRPTGDSASGSLFEMDVQGTASVPLQLQAEESAETSFEGAFDQPEPPGPAEAKFAELEEEIDETLSAIEAAGAPQAEADVTSGWFTEPELPAAPETSSAEAEADASSSWFTEPAPPMPSEPSQEGQDGSSSWFTEPAPPMESEPSQEGQDGTSSWFTESAPAAPSEPNETQEDGPSNWFTDASASPATDAPQPGIPALDVESSDPRIRSFLEEARAAIEAGRYSEAIETASRAFAIDAEAPGAQALIDFARARLDEVDRQAEEHLYHAQKFLEEGDDAAAEALLRDVLRTHPGHREAIDLLERISRQKQGATEGSVPSVPLVHRPPPPLEADLDMVAPALVRDDRAPNFPPVEPYRAHGEAEDSFDGRVIPAAATPMAPVAKQVSGPSFYRFVFYAVLVLLLCGAAAIGLRVLPKFFIGAETPQIAPASERRPVRKEVITIPPTTEAGASRAKPAPGPAPAPAPTAQAPETPGLAPEVPRTLDQARAFVAGGKLDEARALLDEMVEKDPGNRQAVDLRTAVLAKGREREHTQQALATIEAAFKQERYEDSLRLLYRLPPDMQKGETEIMKRNAWFNNGLLFMLGGNGTEATRCFKEALEIDPHDPDAKHLIDFIQSYQSREKDRAYYRYVESLPRRKLDDR